MINTAFEPFVPYSSKLDTIMSQVIDEFTGTLPEISERGEWVLEQLRSYSTRPSKRLRGCLAAAAYDQAKQTELAEAGLRLGAAVEMMQNFLLITDDVIDRSKLRRGEATVHTAYQQLHKTDEHEAGMIGVLVGGIAQHLANYTLINLEEDSKNILNVMKMLHIDIAITGIGQVDDIAQLFGKDFSRDDLLRKYRQKSSYYSVVDPLTNGLLLAGKSIDVRKQAESFGIPTGVAFQLRDDYLGLFGEVAATGKPNLDDIHEGKNTMMIQYAIELGSKAQKAELARIIGNKASNEADLQIVREIVTATGAKDKAMTNAVEYIDQAKQAANATTAWDSKFSDMLCQLADFAVERTK